MFWYIYSRSAENWPISGQYKRNEKIDEAQNIALSSLLIHTRARVTFNESGKFKPMLGLSCSKLSKCKAWWGWVGCGLVGKSLN